MPRGAASTSRTRCPSLASATEVARGLGERSQQDDHPGCYAHHDDAEKRHDARALLADAQHEGDERDEPDETTHRPRPVRVYVRGVRVAAVDLGVVQGAEADPEHQNDDEGADDRPDNATDRRPLAGLHLSACLLGRSWRIEPAGLVLRMHRVVLVLVFTHSN